MAKRPHFLTIGPSIEVVPVTEFYKVRISEEQYTFLWSKFVGPHIERNAALAAEPWKAATNIFMEGMLLGYEVAERRKQSGFAASPDLLIF